MTRPAAQGWLAAAALLCVMVLLRAWDWGNPVIHVDEQYYLLVGNRMLHGAVPYLDIWDRKPVGLFLLFAAIRLLPGDGILAYQLAASLTAWVTALIVRQASKEIGAAERGALAAAALYLIGVSLLGGRGGQAPVFYNLPVAAAGCLTLTLPRRSINAMVVSGAAACLLVGLAIQMKYTPAVEGAVMGLAHLWWFRRRGAGWPALAGAALLWSALGAAPTLAVFGWYAAKGPQALDTFWFANFTSIALRAGYPADQLAMRLLGIVAQLAPLLVAAGATWRRQYRSPAVKLAVCWLLAAIGGFLAIGTFFDHYALPLVGPLAILAAPTLGRPSRLLIATGLLALVLFAVEAIKRPADAAGAREVARIVRANSGSECPYVFIGDTITYLLADACLPTAYAFPNLLAYSTEKGATGIDEAAEVRRVLAKRPPVIVTSDRRLEIWNRDSLAALKGTLSLDYRLVYRTKRQNWNTLVYLRRDRPLRR
ncbi:hypothetical protein [Sphingomonas aerophila]|jgi:hypothetical protein|uniref:4-amino-4-deoxy-L-arabinose transferase-like glycosyltransferase n=1 Tax=Sphingomonas aerophila TaxID=1344948 RepID=A0A7W9BDH3_9SPHN|nr:hypothetical protein [Sphingomonas aerophila]MBB5715254.1 4-amino-4-deoxy-L-arabinose transferase-like glycosyltransferase [Sphingomonas aerophila]